MVWTGVEGLFSDLDKGFPYHRQHKPPLVLVSDRKKGRGAGGNIVIGSDSLHTSERRSGLLKGGKRLCQRRADGSLLR